MRRWRAAAVMIWVGTVWLGTASCTAFDLAPSLSFGALLPLTSAAGVLATPLQNGMQTAAKVMNENGGLFGRVYTLRVADSGADGSSAQVAAQTLLGRYNIVGLIGPWSASDYGILGPWVVQNQLVTVSATTAPDPQKNYLYGLAPGYKTLFGATAFDMHGLGVRNLAVLQPAQAVAYVHGLIVALQALDPNASVTEISYPVQVDYTGFDANSYVQQALGVHPDAVHINCAGPIDCGLVFNALRQQGFNGTIYLNAANASLPSGVTPAAAAGTRAVTTYVKPNASQDYLDFVRAYKDANGGSEPNSTTGLEARGYDAAMWLALSIFKAGSANTPAIDAAMAGVVDPKGRSAGPLDIAAATQTIINKQPLQWRGVSSNFELDASGNYLVPVSVLVCDNTGTFNISRVLSPGDYP